MPPTRRRRVTVRRRAAPLDIAINLSFTALCNCAEQFKIAPRGPVDNNRTTDHENWVRLTTTGP